MSNKSIEVPELNIKVIVIGLMLSVVMGSANVYLGLKAGMTVSASIPAAVVGMLILRAARNLKGQSLGGSILEANQIICYFNYVNRTINGLGVTTKGDTVGYYKKN